VIHKAAGISTAHAAGMFRPPSGLVVDLLLIGLSRPRQPTTVPNDDEGWLKISILFPGRHPKGVLISHKGCGFDDDSQNFWYFLSLEDRLSLRVRIALENWIGTDIAVSGRSG
jgi:hypothetical protein